MLVINRHRILDSKMDELRSGYTAYCESPELIRLLKRRIEKEDLLVLFEQTSSGCWVVPLNKRNKA